jgi:AraC family cel operon transcriptional repressor
MTNARQDAHYNRWRWGDQEVEAPCLRASRWTLKRGASLGRPHYHDFFEVFWIEDGCGRHLVNDEDVPLVTGDCFFMRPPDAHTLQADVGSSLTWTNVSFPARAERGLRERYRKELGWWPWRPEGPVHRCQLKREHLPRMKEFAASLPVDGRRRLDLDWFISSLLRYLDPPRSASGGSKVPAWLEQALARFVADPARLERGQDELVRIAGRCAEHVNRSIRQHYGMTTTELVRQHRLEHAARQLRLTHHDIIDIALGCGFNNLSYFYRCFRERYGTTPRRFRMLQEDR